MLESNQYFLALVFVGEQDFTISAEQHQRVSCVVAIALYRSNERLLPVHMFLRAGKVILDLTKRLAIAPELVFFLDQKLVQKRAGIRVGLRFEPTMKMSDVFPRDEPIHDDAAPPLRPRRKSYTLPWGKQAALSVPFSRAQAARHQAAAQWISSPPDKERSEHLPSLASSGTFCCNARSLFELDCRDGSFGPRNGPGPDARGGVSDGAVIRNPSHKRN
jgi:hypothetical protein